MTDERTFIIHAEVTCDVCGGEGCMYCGFKGSDREPVKFTIGEDGNVLKVEVL